MEYKKIRMISIVIPLYNNQDQISKCIKSILAQSFQHFEIIIINDGSSDRSFERAQSFSDLRIRIFSQQNSGVSLARNHGIRRAKYDYIAFLDADDLWHKDHLQTLWKLHQKYPECNVCACNYQREDETGKKFATIIKGLNFDENDGIISDYFMVASESNPPICSSAVMVKKTALEQIGGFPSGICSGEDLLTWARLAAKNMVAYSKSVLCTYYITTCSAPKRKITNSDPVGEALFKLYLEHKTKSLLKYNSLWHKNRCNIALRDKQRILALSEARKALKYNPRNYKIYIYLLLILAPKKLIRKILH